MTRDDTIRMAREAGATPYTNRHYPDRPTHTFTVEQLDALLAAEREAMVALAAKQGWAMKNEDPFEDCVREIAAIRARGQA